MKDQAIQNQKKEYSLQKHYNNNKKKKDPRFDWRTLFLKNSGGISSKRVLSIIGILSCVGIFIASFITGKPVPEFGDVLLVGCISLYGVDVIPNFYTKTVNKS